MSGFILAIQLQHLIHLAQSVRGASRLVLKSEWDRDTSALGLSPGKRAGGGRWVFSIARGSPS